MRPVRAEWLPALIVIEALEGIEVWPVLVGGLAAGLLITDPAAPEPRPTDDVDLVVELVTYGQYYELGKQLHELGFSEDTEGGAICRWKYQGLSVDIMPTDGAAMGLNSRWFPESYSTARSIELEGGRQIRLVTAPCFLALKLEAFRDRGESDYLASHDLEDIIAVINGREEIVDEVAAAGNEVRGYLARRVGELIGNDRFMEALPCHLAGDEASQARLPIVEQKLRRIASSK